MRNKVIPVDEELKNPLNRAVWTESEKQQITDISEE